MMSLSLYITQPIVQNTGDSRKEQNQPYYTFKCEHSQKLGR